MKSVSKKEKNDFSARFRAKFFPSTSPKEWNDWRWQVKNAVAGGRQMKSILGVADSHLEKVEEKMPFRITPYYAFVVCRSKDLKKTIVPSAKELVCSRGESKDPLAEDSHSPCPGLVRRYPDRALFLATNFCSTHCRYCNRSRLMKENGGFNKNQIADWPKAFAYLRKHKEIRDVLISGGDPLTLPDKILECLLSELRAIPHLEILRIGTKAPAVLPMRITDNLIKILKKYHPLYLSLHFTHPDELTPETRAACARLADAGIPLGSQTVLLKGVNDKPAIMTKLFHGLLRTRVKPYYLFQCDAVAGSAHFRTSVAKGLEIMEKLRGWTSGYAVPYYAIDLPGGGGKVPLVPEYCLGKDKKGNLKFRNYQGKKFSYYDGKD